jgi:hypothetical protein
MAAVARYGPVWLNGGSAQIGPCCNSDASNVLSGPGISIPRAGVAERLAENWEVSGKDALITFKLREV